MNGERRVVSRVRWPARRLAAVCAVLAVLLAVPSAWASFTATVPTSSALTVAPVFDTYPQAVSRQGPRFLHRAEEAFSSAATSTAASAHGGLPGTYAGRTDGPSLRWKLDDGTGSTTTADSSGAANPGTTTGAAWTTGRSGSALSFTGNATTQYAESTRPAVRTDRSYTVSAWMYLTSLGATGDSQTAVSQVGGSTTAFALGYKRGTGWRFVVTAAGGATTPVNLLATPTLNTWYHLVGVYDQAAGSATLYVDGVRSGPVTGLPTLLDGTGSLQVGRVLYTGTWTDAVTGRVDDVKVWNRALGQSEVAALDDPAASLGRYAFSETSGYSAADTSGRSPAKNLTVVNTQLGSGGKVGNGLVLDSALSQYAYSTNSVAPVGRSFTVEAWVLTSSLGAAGAYQDAVSQEAEGGSLFWLGFANDGGASGRWTFGMNTGSGKSEASSNLAQSPANTWTHLVGVYDDAADEVRLYVDGAQKATATHTAAWVPAYGTAFNVGRGRNNGQPANYWKGTLDEVRVFGRALTPAEATGLYSASGTGTDPTGAPGPMTAGRPGALDGPQKNLGGDVAVAFGGTTNAYDDTQVATGPQQFSLECWFRVAKGQNGVLVGYGSARTGAGTTDRALYLDTTGRLRFGVNGTGGLSSVVSPLTYDDAAWHHVAAISGTDGLRLYVDGQEVASLAPLTPGTPIPVATTAGYWRWGGAPLGVPWLSAPATGYLVGSLDEIAVFHTGLSRQQVLWHFHADH
ncbi:hypothetical protein NUM3379_41750 [Kineococcus sp. NUM-3379]